MRAKQSAKFEHGSALRVPAAHDAANWRQLEWWLGDAGRRAEQAGVIAIDTPEGWLMARPGDWIVLSVSGRYYLAASQAQ
jgi:hypothetical protein